MTLTARSATRRFLVLTALRWLPVGLLVPVLVLLPLDRGLTLTEIGLAASLQGIVVLLLELPTGGLADTLGRRPVLLVAGAVGIAAGMLLLTATTFTAFAAVWALQGVHRALDSGPLEAWYVDASGGADLVRGMSLRGVVLGVAIGGGALAGGALVALEPFTLDALTAPVAVSVVVQVLGLVAVALLMSEPGRSTGGTRGAWRSAARTPQVIAEAVGLLRRNRVLAALVAVELTWGFGIVAFESLTPVRLAEVAGGNEVAATLTGPAASAAWAASAAGAAAMPWLGRRVGTARAAAVLRVLQGATVVGIGMSTGVVGVVAAYLVCYVVHGAANPAHTALLHAQVGSTHRATVASLNSMVSHPASAVGVVVLTALADAASLQVAMVLAAVVLALGAPLYAPAWRQESARAAQPVGSPRA